MKLHINIYEYFMVLPNVFQSTNDNLYLVKAHKIDFITEILNINGRHNKLNNNNNIRKLKLR